MSQVIPDNNISWRQISDEDMVNWKLPTDSEHRNILEFSSQHINKLYFQKWNEPSNGVDQKS